MESGEKNICPSAVLRFKLIRHFPVSIYAENKIKKKLRRVRKKQENVQIFFQPTRPYNFLNKKVQNSLNTWSVINFILDDSPPSLSNLHSHLRDNFHRKKLIYIHFQLSPSPLSRKHLLPVQNDEINYGDIPQQDIFSTAKNISSHRGFRSHDILAITGIQSTKDAYFQWIGNILGTTGRIYHHNSHSVVPTLAVLRVNEAKSKKNLPISIR